MSVRRGCATRAVRVRGPRAVQQFPRAEVELQGRAEHRGHGRPATAGDVHRTQHRGGAQRRGGYRRGGIASAVASDELGRDRRPAGVAAAPVQLDTPETRRATRKHERSDDSDAVAQTDGHVRDAAFGFV